MAAAMLASTVDGGGSTATGVAVDGSARKFIVFRPSTWRRGVVVAAVLALGVQTALVTDAVAAPPGQGRRLDPA